jgi:galactose-1-phosphate uridylyltransferase
MGTQKQKKVAQLIVENAVLDKPLNGGQMLAKVRYSEGIQKQPSRILESEGVKEELEVLGFTEANAKMVVTEILLNTDNDPNARLKAADQVFKVHGSYAPEKKDITTQGEKLPSSDLDALAELMANQLKEKKI